ncbi:piggyBac transposable element-derived protein 4-like [Engraulis encrasicolus]|uniref:piggyBac transposable element-derived protein 4-like n=1 Tax=Engraulis encrasicolus TaxID=184585 RepID=UPI002FD6F72A
MSTCNGTEEPAAAVAAMLRRLQERVAQLEAENERLLSVQRAATGLATGSQPVQREQALCLPRKRRRSMFSDSSTGGECLDEVDSCTRLSNGDNAGWVPFKEEAEGDVKEEEEEGWTTAGSTTSTKKAAGSSTSPKKASGFHVSESGKHSDSDVDDDVGDADWMPSKEEAERDDDDDDEEEEEWTPARTSLTPRKTAGSSTSPKKAARSSSSPKKTAWSSTSPKKTAWSSTSPKKTAWSSTSPKKAARSSTSPRKAGWSSPSPRKGTRQRRGSAASASQGSTGGEEEGRPWLDDSTEDHLPPQPEFQPLRTPGPQITQGAEYTALQLFRLFFTDAMLDTLVRNTNKFGAKHHKKKWTDITLPDLFSYMSMLIYMGLSQLPAITDYWKQAKPYNLSFPRSVISGIKFQLITTAIHMSNPDDDAANDARIGTAEYDRLQKVKPMYTELQEACRNNFHPYQHLSVDERMVATKARIGFKQHQKDKPTKWGYKLFVLADSRFGYTWNFFIYEGKSSEASQALVAGKGLSYDSVMQLLPTEALGAGYKLYVDNFYTSPELFKDLLEKMVWACGTIRPNRKGFPTDRPGALDKKSPRGTIRWIREDPLLFVQWKDSRDVHMCSTMHQAHAGETIQRSLKGADGKYSPQDVPVPPAVRDYNKHMGGVDYSDALIGYYNVLHKTSRWYRTLFFHFIDIAITNAFILHKEIALSKGEKPKTQKGFRERLLVEMSEAGSPSTAIPPPSAPYLLRGMHLPVYIGGNATSGRRRCTVCQLKTPIVCEACDRPFCFVSARNCYNDWHKQKIP